MVGEPAGELFSVLGAEERKLEGGEVGAEASSADVADESDELAEIGGDGSLPEEPLAAFKLMKLRVLRAEAEGRVALLQAETGAALPAERSLMGDEGSEDSGGRAPLIQELRGGTSTSSADLRNVDASRGEASSGEALLGADAILGDDVCQANSAVGGDCFTTRSVALSLGECGTSSNSDDARRDDEEEIVDGDTNSTMPATYSPIPSASSWPAMRENSNKPAQKVS